MHRIIYTGKIQTNCRGIGASSISDRCIFSGTEQNSYVLYTQQHKATASVYSQAGYTVYLHWDTEQSSFVSFKDLSDDELSNFANSTADIVCNEDNIGGFALEFGSYGDHNDEFPFYNKLRPLIEACNKRWGVFALSSGYNETM